MTISQRCSSEMVKPGPKPRPILDRFTEKTKAGDDGCIVWTASGNGAGYGAMFIAKGKRVLAHRWSYEHFVGPIPDGLHIDHLCRNRMCVNPEHLEAVPQRANTLRGIAPTAINAAKTHCHKGHPLSGENLYITPGRGSRQCRECHRTYERDRYQSRIKKAKEA